MFHNCHLIVFQIVSSTIAGADAEFASSIGKNDALKQVYNLSGWLQCNDRL